MSELTFEVVDVPKTDRGRTAAPNPYSPAVDALLKLDKGQALSFSPLAPEHTDKVIMRRMRAVAPENIALRFKFDKDANRITVWATDKVKTKPKTETETAPETAPETTDETVKADETAKPVEAAKPGRAKRA